MGIAVWLAVWVGMGEGVGGMVAVDVCVGTKVAVNGNTVWVNGSVKSGAAV